MGTDIGAGTTFNMLQTLNEAYKVLQLQGYRLSAYEAFYLVRSAERNLWALTI